MDLMPKPTPRGDGRWMIQLPRKAAREAGKSRLCVYGRSPEECERNYLAAMGAGTVRVRPGSISEFVADAFAPWIRSRVGSDTFTRYDLDWRTVIGPKLGHLLFSELTPEAVQDAIEGSPKGDSSKHGARNVLGQIVRLAIAKGRAGPEHLVMVQLVKLAPVRRKERRDMAAKARAMLAAAERLGHWTEGFVYTAMTLGCRKGEVCSIKRSDVDLEAGTLTISRQRNHTQGERDKLKGKRQGVTRVIGLPRPILERLLGYFRPGAIYLVTRPDGSPPPTNHFERYLAAVEEAAGVRMTPHDFRSAAVCNLLEHGVDDHTIEDLVGHGSRDMIRWYRDNRAERTRDALARLTHT